MINELKEYVSTHKLEERTNGDVIKAVFPNAVTRIFKNTNLTYIEVEQNDEWIADFDIEWWNAPYKENKK